MAERTIRRTSLVRETSRSTNREALQMGSRFDVRRLAGMLFATWYRLRGAGRVSGTSFIVRNPSLFRVEKGGSIRIGEGVMIEHGARIVARDRLVIGDDVYIGKNSTIIAFAPLHIGPRTLFGENVSVHTEDHGPAGRRGDFLTDEVWIGEDSWIGAGTVVLRGSRIGDRSTIGANSVVRGHIPDDVLAVGAPAVVKRALG
ncbi:acyltransferase [Microbacterium sp. Root53]|uniref:acyltransferase n=1 Tax=Microbacterium sp. Root53 TaxID=1736553 RepID=UPI0012E369C4|nr:acyltransferase [Microbacterium sp. Root53]